MKEFENKTITIPAIEYLKLLQASNALSCLNYDIDNFDKCGHTFEELEELNVESSKEVQDLINLSKIRELIPSNTI